MNGWIETYQGQVNAWECDMMGHMNVQFYRTRLSEGLGRLYNQLGLTPGVIRSGRRTLLTAAERILYQRELRAGGLCHMRSGVLSVSNRSVKTVNELIDSESGDVSASFEVTGAYVDMNTGESIPLPDYFRNRSAGLMVSWKPAYPSSPPNQDLVAGIDDAGMFETYRNRINTDQCDHFGIFHPSFQFFGFSHAAGPVMSAVGLPYSELVRRNWGIAALEYLIEYRQPLHAGNLIVLRSGFLEAGEKVFRFFHRMLNSETGEVACTIVVTCVIFDTLDRKSLPLPDQLRTYAENSIKVRSKGIVDISDSIGPPWPVTFKGTAGTWECDDTDQLSEIAFADGFSKATDHLFSGLGLTQTLRTEGNLCISTRESRRNLQHTIRKGDLMLIKSGIIEMGAKSARIVHRFYEGRSGELAATFEATVILTDLGSGEARSFPDFVRTAGQARLIDLKNK